MCVDEMIITIKNNNCLRRALSCSCYPIRAAFWISPTVFLLLLLLCLNADYHCHVLSSICYCTNDEMNPFKQHLNRWQKPQLVQWLSPLISNHFSNRNQRHLLAFFVFFPPESHQMRLRMSRKLPKQASSGEHREEKEKRRNTVVGNKWERTSFCILR